MGSLMLSFTHIIPIIGGITLLINGINAQTKTRRGAFRFATTKINRFSDSARCSYGLILPLKLNLLFVEPTPVVSGDKKNPTDQGRNERQQRKLGISTINDGPLLGNFMYWIGWWLQQKVSLPLPEIVTKERTIISKPVCILVYILWYNHYIRTMFISKMIMECLGICQSHLDQSPWTYLATIPPPSPSCLDVCHIFASHWSVGNG